MHRSTAPPWSLNGGAPPGAAPQTGAAVLHKCASISNKVHGYTPGILVPPSPFLSLLPHTTLSQCCATQQVSGALGPVGRSPPPPPAPPLFLVLLKSHPTMLPPPLPQVNVMLSNYELWRQVLCKGTPGTQQYHLVVSLPDNLVAVHLPSALPEFRNPSHEGVRCMLCGHGSDDMGPLAQYRSQTWVSASTPCPSPLGLRDPEPRCGCSPAGRLSWRGDVRAWCPTPPPRFVRAAPAPPSRRCDHQYPLRSGVAMWVHVLCVRFSNVWLSAPRRNVVNLLNGVKGKICSFCGQLNATVSCDDKSPWAGAPALLGVP
jgi:hypothetical protein